METSRPTARLCFGTAEAAPRALPEEVAVALSFNGTTQAVMMATPADLIDFAYGFALTEGIAAPDEIVSVEVVAAPKGLDVQVWLNTDAQSRLTKRRRTMAGPVGCGLCGIDSLDEAMRHPAMIAKSPFTMTPFEVMSAIAALPKAQPLHDATRSVHAAGFWNGRLLSVREDVGRHNALDKLVGHMVRTQIAPTGAVVLTSRVSIDLVQKIAAFGAPVVIAVSAPTAQAVTLAEQAGLTLIALARPDRFEVFAHPARLQSDNAHVA